MKAFWTALLTGFAAIMVFRWIKPFISPAIPSNTSPADQQSSGNK